MPNEKGAQGNVSSFVSSARISSNDCVLPVLINLGTAQIVPILLATTSIVKSHSAQGIVRRASTLDMMYIYIILENSA